MAASVKIVLALFVAHPGLAAHAGILAGPTINPANGHTYCLLSQNTWSNAEAEAISLGGHLATIRLSFQGRIQTYASLIRRENTRKDSTECESCHEKCLVPFNPRSTSAVGTLGLPGSGILQSSRIDNLFTLERVWKTVSR